MWLLQQYLPFTVLKPANMPAATFTGAGVATVLTVYGIETMLGSIIRITLFFVATVLTVYGIETASISERSICYMNVLQQYLPFTVLKQT